MSLSDAEVDAHVALFFKAQRFAHGRVTVAWVMAPPDEGFETRWKPKVCGEFVRNDGDPPHGFKTADEAREAAKRYRESCRAFVAKELGQPPPKARGRG
jgi:hypothetical protein